MYYITRHGATMPLRSRIRGHLSVFYPDNEYLPRAFYSNLVPSAVTTFQSVTRVAGIRVASCRY